MKYQRILVNRMQFLNKRIFNPVVLKSAGSSHSPISIIRHVGRRSGINYTTPVSAQTLLNRFVFLLLYGYQVDWFRNVLVAGQGTVVWRGKEYAVDKPESFSGRADLQTLTLALRLIVQIVGAGHFIQMKSCKVICHSAQ